MPTTKEVNIIALQLKQDRLKESCRIPSYSDILTAALQKAELTTLTTMVSHLEADYQAAYSLANHLIFQRYGVQFGQLGSTEDQSVLEFIKIMANLKDKVPSLTTPMNFLIIPTI